MPPRHEFRAVVRPDGTATVVYVPESQPATGVLHASGLSFECQGVADIHNRLLAEREAARKAGQGSLDF